MGRLHDVSWEPGTGCRLAFLLDEPGADTTFVFVEMTPTGVGRTDYRQDPRLPGTALASDPGWVAGRLAPALGEPVLGCRVRPVRYRPGSRCVWRYLLETPSGGRELYAKALRPECFTRTARHLALLARTGLVPRLVASWPDVQVAVTEAVPGRTLSSLLGDARVPAVERVRLARGLGDLLARVHDVHDVDAPPRTAADQVESLRGLEAAVRSADAGIGRRLSALTNVLADAALGEGATVLGHGGFRAGQVLRGPDGRLVALDVDGLCRSDPERDLGTVLAHLRWQGVRLPAQRQVLRVAERAALGGYQARAGRVDPERLLWWRAAGLLQVAARRYRRLEVTDWPLIPALLDDAAQLLEALQPDQTAVLLRLALGGVADFPESLAVETADPLPSASGKRAVVCYRVRGLTGDQPTLVVGKSFTEGRRARLLHEHLSLLHDGPFGRGPLRVPEPLGLLPAQRLVLYRHCAGIPLDTLTDPDLAAEGVRRAARWLARLHRSDVGFPRRLSIEAETVSARAWAAVVGGAHPELGRNACDLAESWADAVRLLPPAREVPIHKDYHPGHVLLGEETWVIDLDEARQGHPSYDVAHFCAYLGLAFGEAAGDRLADLFMREYGAETGWQDSGRLGPFLAYTWLKIAKQWAMGSGPCRDSLPAERATGAALALERGWACLNGSSTSCAAGRVSPRPSS
jgi:aminoglycoside phosphotransferase (APT) family kinase protein